MANLAEALKASLPAEAADPIAPAETPDIGAEFEADAKDTGKEVPGKKLEEKGEEPKKEEKPKTPEQVPWKALKDERDKRQKAEAELAYLRGRLEGTQAQEKGKEPSVDDLDNEFMLAPSSVLDARVGKRLTQAEKDLRAEMSDAMMRITKDDYPAVLEEFASLANANPELWARAAEEKVPALAIYNFMKARKSNQQPVDEKTLRAQIEAEVEEKYKKQAALKEAKDTPPSPAGAPGSGETLAGKFSTIDDLFAERRRRVGR